MEPTATVEIESRIQLRLSLTPKQALILKAFFQNVPMNRDPVEAQLFADVFNALPPFEQLYRM